MIGAPASPRPGMTPERIGMFADAIFAIAITLLVLEIPRPDETEVRDLPGFLSDHSGSFLAFVLAFLMLWFTWRAHHTLFDQLHRASQAILLLHVPLLLFAAFLPYTMSLWSEASANGASLESQKVALAMFSGTEAILMFCQAALFTLALVQKLSSEQANPRRMATSAWVNWGGGVLWAASVWVALTWGEAATYLWMATPLVTGVIVFVRIRLNRVAIRANVTSMS